MRTHPATRAALALAAALAAAPGAAAGACPPELRAQAVVTAARVEAAWRAGRPLRFLAAREWREARCVRAALVARLARRLGPVAGYKAALTTRALQARFGTDRPVLGVLLAGMLRAGPRAMVPLHTTARTLFEPDLMVRVGDAAALEAARTPLEAALALDALVPFVELPEVLYAHGLRPTAAAIAAINAGAALGLTGPAVPLAGGAPERIARIRGVRVRLHGGTPRRLLAEGSARALGDPLGVVLWLRDALAAEGLRPRRGDLLSLGSLLPPRPARPGRVLEARYEIPGAPPAALEVAFRP